MKTQRADPQPMRSLVAINTARAVRVAVLPQLTTRSITEHTCQCVQQRDAGGAVRGAQTSKSQHVFGPVCSQTESQCIVAGIY